MLYIVWAILNIGLFLFFIAICLNATKLIKEKFGILASIVFVFGLLSFIGRTPTDQGNNEPSTNKIKTWHFNDSDSLGRKNHIDIDLEETPISTYCLGILYAKDKMRLNNIPVSAFSYSNGLISGTSWKPTSIIINRAEDRQQIEYQVDGTITWSLLGMPNYHQSKHWQGVAVVK